MPRSTKPTKAEAENLWDETRLTAYIEERNQAAAQRVIETMDRSTKPLQVINAKAFNPQRW